MAERASRQAAPDVPGPAGNAKVTRQDWLKIAMDLLISDGVSEVKVLTIGQRLKVSRSSFYWYFRSHSDLLDHLLAEWERTNTGIMVHHCEMEAPTITAAVCNFFRCIVDPAGFDHQLDFAVREWSRRDDAVRGVVDRSDRMRRDALARMFERHGYDPAEADVRARVLYFQQIGYHALELAETLEERLALVEGYLLVFTGKRPNAAEVAEFKVFAHRLLGDGGGAETL
ncbi:MAG: TetR/AcrR family transcriptional regulator [Pseudomonadota bacterium]